MAEFALAKSKDLGWLYREHEGRAAPVAKCAAVHLVLPPPVPLRGPRLGEALEHFVVGEPDGVAHDHHVQPFVPAVAAGDQDHVRVALEVDGLLLGAAGGEVDGPVEPHGNERGDVVATAAGSLNRVSISVTGLLIEMLLCRCLDLVPVFHVPGRGRGKRYRSGPSAAVAVAPMRPSP